MEDKIIENLKERKQNLIKTKRTTEAHSDIYIKLNERISEIEDIIYLIIQVIGDNSE